jgi:hypothetical protein
MEVMCGHRDGYCLARNNFRVYHDPDTDRILFFPHGMDQLFGKANSPMQPQMNGLVARAVMETPQGRQRYRQRFAVLLTNVFVVRAIDQEVERRLAQLRSVLSAKEERGLERELAALKERVAKRHHDLARQIAEPEPQPLRFIDGVAPVTGWQAVDPPASGRMERTNGPGGRAALHIRAGPVTSASWRAKARLGHGRYRFEGAVCTLGVKPLDFGKNQGACLRVAGARGKEISHVTGDQDWKALGVEFEVPAPDQEVELICELRARRGEAWFDADLLRLLRLPEP